MRHFLHPKKGLSTLATNWNSSRIRGGLNCHFHWQFICSVWDECQFVSSAHLNAWVKKVGPYTCFMVGCFHQVVRIKPLGIPLGINLEDHVLFLCTCQIVPALETYHHLNGWERTPEFPPPRAAHDSAFAPTSSFRICLRGPTPWNPLCCFRLWNKKYIVKVVTLNSEALRDRAQDTCKALQSWVLIHLTQPRPVRLAAADSGKGGLGPVIPMPGGCELGRCDDIHR